MRLVMVELHRVLARKAVWLAVVGAVVVVLVALFGVHQAALSVNASRANAQQILEEQLAWWEESGQEEADRCFAEQETARRQSGDARIDFGCEQMARPPQLEDFLMSMPSLATQYEELLGYLVYPFLFLALALGSTSVAAEFTHRTMGSWLTFVPRRVPVFLSKVLAAALAAVPVVGLGLVLLLLGVPALFRFHGIDDGVSGPQWVSLAWMALRIVLLAMIAGALGAAAAFLLRHSAAVLGLMIGYLVLAEGILRGMVTGLTPYLLGVNIDAFVKHGTEWVEWPTFCDDVTVMCREIVHPVSFAHGATVLLALLAVVVVAGLLHFRRADVS